MTIQAADDRGRHRAAGARRSRPSAARRWRCSPARRATTTRSTSTWTSRARPASTTCSRRACCRWPTSGACSPTGRRRSRSARSRCASSPSPRCTPRRTCTGRVASIDIVDGERRATIDLTVALADGTADPHRHRRHRRRLTRRHDHDRKKHMGTLEGKVALVSGSGRGIGARDRAEARGRGRARRRQRPRRRARERDRRRRSRPPAARPSRCVGSVTDADFGERFVQLAVDTFGGLDIIVNNAGYTWDSVIQKMTDEQWDAILDVHLKAPFRILRAAQPVISALAKKEAAEGGGVLPQGRQHLLDRRPRRQRRAGELLGRQGRHHRPDQDPREGVGPLQRDGQRGRVRLHQDAAHRAPTAPTTSTSPATRSRSA